MRYLLGFVLFFSVASLRAQQSYTLEAWFWHNRLSTTDSIYVQDADVSNEASIPIHFQKRDFQYLDSVAMAVGFWNLPDTLRTEPDRTVGDAVFGSATLPITSRTEIIFRTPQKQKHVIMLSWPQNRAYMDALRNFEFALVKVVQEQPYANTLPKPKLRQ